MRAILFVCLGNICRSPTAEAVFRQRVEQQGLAGGLMIDSAGTGDWHTGKSPDSRARRAAAARGYNMEGMVARQVERADFSRFDYVLAMDQANLGDLIRLRPEDFTGHLGLFLDFAAGQDVTEVPDPYYGAADGFDTVLDLIEAASDGLIRALRDSADAS